MNMSSGRCIACIIINLPGIKRKVITLIDFIYNQFVICVWLQILDDVFNCGWFVNLFCPTAATVAVAPSRRACTLYPSEGPRSVHEDFEQDDRAAEGHGDDG